MSNALNVHTARALGKIIDLCERTAVVNFLDPLSGEVVTGTVRHIVMSENDISFPGQLDDIRECALRITMASGFEKFLPMERVVTLIHFGEMAEDKSFA